MFIDDNHTVEIEIQEEQKELKILSLNDNEIESIPNLEEFCPRLEKLEVNRCKVYRIEEFLIPSLKEF